jgi:hypothetical protein
MAKFAGKSKLWDGLEPDGNDVSTDTHTHNHTPTHTPKVKKTKDRRVQLLTYGTLVDRMDDYAALNGLSRAEVFEQAVSEFLERHNT